jgi:hypothetical protein
MIPREVFPGPGRSNEGEVRVAWGGQQSAAGTGAAENEPAALGTPDGELSQLAGVGPGGAAIAVLRAAAAARDQPR